MRYPERNGLLAACHELDTALIAYTSMAHGILTGKFRGGERKPSLLQHAYFRMNEQDLFKEGRDNLPLNKV